MRILDWLKRQTLRSCSDPRCRSAVLWLEELEARLTPDITLTNALLVNVNDQPVTAPDTGEMVFVQANWSTQGLPGNASYRIKYDIDGVTLFSPVLTAGAGHSQTEYWYWYLGGWYASPGQHTVTVSIDPDNYGSNALSFGFTPVTADDLPQKFINPIGGTPFQTWDITTYPDVDARAGSFADYTGGHITFDGETGHDLALANFTAMDAGVPDVAAADGTVVAVQDGNYDRNTMVDSTAQANYVVVDHGNGWESWYYHMRTDSILVHVGDHVVAGQVLGLCGSSGLSTGAHIDWGVTHNGDIVEPYYDPDTYFASVLPYQGTVRDLLDSGITRSVVFADADLRAGERPVEADVFNHTQSQQYVVWLRGATIAGDTVAFQTYKPDGTLYSPLSYSFTSPYTGAVLYYVYFILPNNLDEGTWHVSIQIAGVGMANDAFEVTATGGVAAARVSQGSTYVPNGRTTPIDFGTVNPGDPPPQKTFTVSNIGSAPLTLSNLVLPDGYSLVGSFPSTINAGSSATFTVQMATDTSGSDAGIISFDTSDPNAPTYSFDIKGTVTGGNTGAIHGQVFNDINGDGIEEAGDAGLPGWTVCLIDPGSVQVIATTTTGFNGYYAFLNLTPGTYRVRETPPDGWTQSTTDPDDVTVATDDVLVSPFGVGMDGPRPSVAHAPAHTTAAKPSTFAAPVPDVTLVSAIVGKASHIGVTTFDADGNVGTWTVSTSDTGPRVVLPLDDSSSSTSRRVYPGGANRQNKPGGSFDRFSTSMPENRWWADGAGG
jgi:murein DD-endopeptidase MepM/ murein hydrolase activator NlpD